MMSFKYKIFKLKASMKINKNLLNKNLNYKIYRIIFYKKIIIYFSLNNNNKCIMNNLFDNIILS